MGAFVCCSEVLKQYLVNRARPFIFSTALPPYVAAQMRAAIPIVASADAERTRLTSLSVFLRKRLRDAGFDAGRRKSGGPQWFPRSGSLRIGRRSRLTTESGTA
jgi:7-keto-8-aminopelargonate synthetase-like enzyme